MAADNQLVIEIVLEDGSIQKGFAKIKDAGSKASEGIGSKLTNAFSTISNPTDILAGLVLIKKGFDLIQKAAEKAFELVLDGEKVKAVNAQFTLLAENAGIAGGAIRTQLEEAANGLVDTTDLLKSASQGFVQFGSEAKRLPEILTLARQVGAVFGGELTDNFERLNQAIAAGSQKALKSVGIYLDTDKVLKEYAKTLGITVGNIDQAQKQQAILNAVLEQGQKRYAGVDLSLLATTDSYTRLKNVGKDTLESLSVLASNVFGPAFKAAFDVIATGLNNFNNLIARNVGSGAEKVAASIKFITSEIEKLNLQIAQSKTGSFVNTELEVIQLNKLKEELRLLTFQNEAYNGSIVDTRQKTKQLEESTSNILKLIKQQSDEQERLNSIRLNSENTFQKTLSSIQEQGIQSQLNALQHKSEEESKADDNAKIFALQQEQEAAVHAAKLAEIDIQYEADKKALKELGAEGELMALEHRNALILGETQRHSDQLDTLDKEDLIRKEANIKKLNDVLRAQLAQGLTNAAAAIGTALQKGGNAFEAFAQSAVGSIGDISIALGSAVIQNSLALLVFGKALASLDPSQATLGLAIGAGLVAFGTALKASVHQSAEASVAGGAFAGGSSGSDTFSPSPSTDFTDNSASRKVDTAVTVNIQGDVLDSEESGMRITKILNDAFDKSGVVIRKGAFA